MIIEHESRVSIQDQHSTIDLAWFFAHPNHHHHHCHLNLSQPWSLSHLVPLPSREGCGPVDIGEGGARGGTQAMGGLDGASTEQPMTFIVGHFCSFSYFLMQLTPSLFDAHDKAPNDSEQGQTIARQPTRSPKWHTGSNANPADETTTQWVKHQPVSPADKMTN